MEDDEAVAAQGNSITCDLWFTVYGNMCSVDGPRGAENFL